MTCAKPVPFQKFYHPATSSKRKFSRTASSTCRCAATPPRSTRCLCASICISAVQCLFPAKDVKCWVDGTAQRILHCDVTSLYPSIMLVYKYLPSKDELGVFSGLLRDLRTFRVKAKELARDAADEESRNYFNALQSTFKILINSFYGYLGFQMGHFNDFDAANQVTAKGRDLIQSVIAWLKKNAAQIVEVDTDGIYFVPPESVKTTADEEQFGANLAATL